MSYYSVGKAPYIHSTSLSPPSGSVPSLKYLLSILTKEELDSLVSDLSDTYPPLWDDLLCELSPAFVGRITGTLIDSLKRDFKDGKLRARAALDKIKVWDDLTTDLFFKTLNELLLESTVRDLRKALARNSGKASDQTAVSTLRGLDEPMKLLLLRQASLWEAIHYRISEGIVPRWQRVCINLSQQPAFKGKITLDKISTIRNNNQRGDPTCDAFIKQFWNMSGFTVGSFVKALEAADPSYGCLCETIKEMAGASDADPGQAVNEAVQVSQYVPAKSMLETEFDDFFKNKLGLYDEVIEALADQKNPAHSWKGVLKMLSSHADLRKIFNDHERLSRTIESNHQDSHHKSERYYQSIKYMSIDFTVRHFVWALYKTHDCYERLCQKICEAAGEPDYLDKIV